MWKPRFPRPDAFHRIGPGFVVAAFAMMSCPQPGHAQDQKDFSDGFEVRRFLDLFAEDRSRWTHFQSTFPQNRADIVSDQHRSGSSAIRLFAVPSTSEVSKSAIEKEGFEMRTGQLAQATAWFFIPVGADLKNLFLLDLECKVCWPRNSIFPDKNPGIRIKLKDGQGTPVVERRKIGLPDMRNEMTRDQALPRGRWFRLDWRLKLTPDDDGESEILLDGEPIFRARGATFPNPERFKKWGIELRDTLYDRFQIGITANSTPNPIELLIDDVSFKVE